MTLLHRVTQFALQSRRDQQTQYSYDGFNRVTQIRHYGVAGGGEDTCQQVNFYYDSNPYVSGYSTYVAGRLAARTYQAANCGQAGNAFTEMFSYTQAGQVNKKLLRVWRTVSGYLLWADLDSSYGYDNEGKLTSVTYPQALDGSNNVVGGTRYTYGYDSMARLDSMTGPNGAMISSATHGPAGELLSLVGVVNETRTYNTRLQLTRLSAPHMTCVNYWTCINDGADYTYTYSANQNNGRIIQQTDNSSGEQVTYQYDELNRLISAVTADNPSVPQWGQAFLYDGFGNLTDKSVIKGSAPVWHGLVDPATNRASGYTYDANGNASSPSLQNSFDIENRIVSQTAWVQSSQYLYGYGYDPDNRRIYNATSTYDPGSGGFTLTNEEVTFWSPTGQRMGTYLLLVNPGGGGYAPSLSFRWTNSERVYFGNRLIWRGGTTVYSDRLGSVGKYFPYGEERPSATAGDVEKFATYYRDGATGLDYAVNRYYDAGTGRFLTPDLGAANNAVSLTGNWNRYTYVGGDPINKTDPLGLCSPDDEPPCYSATSYYSLSTRTGITGPSILYRTGPFLGDARADQRSDSWRVYTEARRAFQNAKSAIHSLRDTIPDDCQADLDTLGFTAEEIISAVDNARLLNGDTSPVNVSSLWLYAPGDVYDAIRFEQKNTTVSQYLRNNGAAAIAQFKGNEIYISGAVLASAEFSNGFYAATFVHEVLHNLGLFDGDIRNKLNISNELWDFLGTEAISIRLQNDCFK